MDESQIEELLRISPNVRRAKDGVLIETEEGILHITGIIDNSEYEGLGEDALFFSAFCSPGDIKKINTPSCSSDYLLKLRAEAIVDNPRLVRVFKSRRGTKKNWSLEQYYSTRSREELYLSSLSKGNQEKLKNIPAGSAYIESVNAMCIKTKKGNVILVSEPLENFLYFMNIFFCGEDFGIEEEDRSTAFLIAQRIMAGYESVDFDLDPRGTLSEPVEASIRNLTDLQYQFILGHEYSHHLLGHLDESKLVSEDITVFMSMHQGKGKIRHYRYSHNLEYDADWHSIKNIRGNASFKEAMANAAFLTLMYLETTRIIVNFVNPSSSSRKSTHPDPIERIYKIRKKLNNKYGFTREQIDHGIKHLSLCTDDFIKQYLVFNIENFERYGSVYLPNYKDKILVDRVDF